MEEKKKQNGFMVWLAKTLGPKLDKYRKTEPEIPEIYLPETEEDLVWVLKKLPEDVLKKEDFEKIIMAMTFSEKKVRDIMLPRDNITFVHINDFMGPLTLDKLYQSGFSHFPVLDTKGGIAGIIHTSSLNSLEIKETDRASSYLDKNVYYRETGICSLNSAITLLNRYVAYKYKDYRNYYDIQKMLEFNGEKYVEWNYEFTDAKAKAAHAGRKATVKKGSELGILTDYGVNNSFSNSTKIPYEFKDEKGKIIKSKIQFKRTECTGKGLTPKKLAELLIEHPEGVYIHGANSNGPHAVVVASYTFDGSTYKFRVLDPAKGAADFTVKNKDSKIMKTWGITLSQLDEYRVIIKG